MSDQADRLCKMLGLTGALSFEEVCKAAADRVAELQNLAAHLREQAKANQTDGRKGIAFGLREAADEIERLQTRGAELERRNEELEAAPLERHVLNEARIAELENKHCPWCNPRRPENNDG